jgi:mRNA degradation ribonuclease J1/J2
MRVPSEIIKGRLRLAYAGAVFVSVALDRERNQILELRMRGPGALLEEEDRKMEPEAKARCQARLDSIKGNRPPVSEIENEFRAEMRRFFKARLKTRPMIFVSVINVQEKVF